MSILRVVIAVAVLVGAAGCQSEEKSPLADSPFVAEARNAVGPPWTDQQLVTLGAIACSAPGSVYDMSVVLKAERAALDYTQARVIAQAAVTHMCPR
ncbi:hypothetical protein DMP17_22305 [Pseudonocardia sp. TMWB2A]